MAQSRIKRFLLTVVLIVLLAIIFILLGGGGLLKSAGRWISGMGSKAEGIKEKVVEKAQTIEKAVEKIKNDEKGEKR